ncbi:CsgG/HfaB family protein [Synechocystis sp. CS-94]|nr:CsgG/HfaB family protein [Synechocystis sp. CS-94]
MAAQNVDRLAVSLASKALPFLLILTGICSGNLTAQAQSKPTISVPEFKNDTNMSWWWWTGNTSRELADALSNELTSTGNFQVVERQNLGSVLSEQELAELGLTRPETSAQKGQLTGAQYIVLGRVTAYQEGVSSESGGNNFGLNLGLFSIGNSERQAKQEAYVAIDLRVVDSTTGEVVYARTVEGRATDTAASSANNVNILGIVNTGQDNQSEAKAPVGKALRAGLVEITDYLSCVMVEQDGCVQEYQDKEKRRREKTKDTLLLE